MQERSVEAAKFLMDAHARKLKFEPFVDRFQLAGLDDAYAVQRDYVGLQMAERRVRPIGYKIGLTSPRMQAMCGIDRPIAGVVLADRMHSSGAHFEARSYGRFGLEFEIAVRLGSDLRSTGETVALSQVAAAVEAVCPAVEIVDDRHCDYARLDVFSLVADNAWNAGIVLGEFRTQWPDLAAAEGIVTLDGAVEDRGFGRDVLGHPFQSVAWLAEHLSTTGEGLHAGDIVMTGNLVTTKFPALSSVWRFEVLGLGAVALSLQI